MKEEGTEQPWKRKQSFPGLTAKGLYCPGETICGRRRNTSPPCFHKNSLASWWPAEREEVGSLDWLHRVFHALRLPAIEGRGTASLAWFPLA